MLEKIYLQRFAEELPEGAEEKDKGKETEDKEKTKETKEKTFTQEDLDTIITKRLERERKSWEAKVKEEADKAKMTESERLKAEKAEAEKKATDAINRANTRLIRSEVIKEASKMNIVDADAAYALMNQENIVIKDNDEVTGVAEALKALIEKKPYLVSDETTFTKRIGDNQNDGKGGKGGQLMNDLIRKAVGR